MATCWSRPALELDLEREVLMARQSVYEQAIWNLRHTECVRGANVQTLRTAAEAESKDTVRSTVPSTLIPDTRNRQTAPPDCVPRRPPIPLRTVVRQNKCYLRPLPYTWISLGKIPAEVAFFQKSQTISVFLDHRAHSAHQTTTCDADFFSLARKHPWQNIPLQLGCLEVDPLGWSNLVVIQFASSSALWLAVRRAHSITALTDSSSRPTP